MGFAEPHGRPSRRRSRRWRGNPPPDYYFRRRRSFDRPEDDFLASPFTRLAPLDHTVKGFSTVRPLMRTVLIGSSLPDVGHIDLPGVQSPVLAVRASGRSRGLIRSFQSGLHSSFNPAIIPRRAWECAKRQIRREVLLAKGRGGGDHRPPRFRSEWRC